MASALEKKPCSKCEKGGGVTTCDGCQQSFCIKHIIEHRQELALQMDNIGQEYDSLRRDLIQEDLTHPVLVRIDEWEQNSIVKIQMAAEKARADLRQLINQAKNNMKTSVDKIADELQIHRRMDDYTEIDLTSWSETLTEVRKLLTASSTITITQEENTSTAIYLIKLHDQKQLKLSTNSARVSQKSVLLSQKLIDTTQERFDKTMNLVSLSEDGLRATYTNVHRHGYQTIFGKNLYVSGVHHICFRIENKGMDNFFFGIVTLSQNIKSEIFETSTANGWWGFDYLVVNGERKENCGEKILRTDDVVKFTLDCDNKRIRFENYRTKTIVQSSINIIKCPFPWKIAISLSRPHDVLRIL